MDGEVLIQPERLAKARRVLFLTHLAIGDFTYLQTYFAAFAAKYPHLKIDVWVDEVRRTRCFWRWKSLQKYSLYDWLKAIPYIDHVYTKTYSPGVLRSSIQAARERQYDVVISLATLRAHQYAVLARRIAPKGFVIGMSKSLKWHQWIKKAKYGKLDAALDRANIKLPNGHHITDEYAAWFEKICGLVVSPAERKPVVNLPREWATYGKLTLLKWGITDRQPRGRVIFVNLFAKDKKRCWPVTSAFELIKLLKFLPEYEGAIFVLNAMPDSMKMMQKQLDKHSLVGVVLFTAKEHFFQLPAILANCDLVISVETAVIHLAAALQVPVISLMRQKNPEWAPWGKADSSIITTTARRDWIKTIPAARVALVVKSVSAQ